MAKLVEVGSIRCYFESLSDPRHTQSRSARRRHRHRVAAIVRMRRSHCHARWAVCQFDWLAQHLPPLTASPRTVFARLDRPQAPGVPTLLPSVDRPGRADDRLTAKRRRHRRQDLAAVRTTPPTTSPCTSSRLGQRGRRCPRSGRHRGKIQRNHRDSSYRTDRSENTLITIDAMGCQKDIVRKSSKAKATASAVKDNQPKLKAAVESFFDEQIARDFEDLRYRHHETRRGPRPHRRTRLLSRQDAARCAPCPVSPWLALVSPNPRGRDVRVRYYILPVTWRQRVRRGWGRASSVHFLRPREADSRVSNWRKQLCPPLSRCLCSPRASWLLRCGSPGFLTGPSLQVCICWPCSPLWFPPPACPWGVAMVFTLLCASRLAVLCGPGWGQPPPSLRARWSYLSPVLYRHGRRVGVVVRCLVRRSGYGRVPAFCVVVSGRSAAHFGEGVPTSGQLAVVLGIGPSVVCPAAGPALPFSLFPPVSCVLGALLRYIGRPSPLPPPAIRRSDSRPMQRYFYFDCGPCLIGPKLFHTKLFRRTESSEGAADGAPLCRPP